MTARPVSVEWATDSVYDAAGDAWDGTPTKVAIPAATRAEGFEPTQKLPAQYFNELVSGHALALAYLLNVQIANWRRCLVTDAGGADPWGGDDVVFRCGLWNQSITAPLGELMLFGDVDSDSGNQLLARSESGAIPGAWNLAAAEIIDATTPATSIYAAIHDTTNGLIVICGTDHVYTRPQSGSTTWTQRVAPAGVDLRALAFGSGTGAPVLIAVGEELATDDMRIYSSADGTTWTLRDSQTDRPMYGVANQPGVMWVAVGDNNAGVAKIYRSANGTAWTESTSGVPTGANSALRSVVYDSRSGLFCACGLTGTRVTSPDGITWTDQTDTADGWGTDQIPSGGLATDGEGTILAVSQGTAPRVWVSTDGGVTWSGGHGPQMDAITLAEGSPFYAGIHGWIIPGRVNGVTDASIYVSLRL